MLGFKELDRVLKELAEVNKGAARSALRESLQTAARPVVAAARTKAPKRSGRLKRSMGTQVRRVKGGLAVAIGPRTKGKSGARHGHLVEFGHRLVRGGRVVGHVPARPFLRPAWDAEGGEKALKRLAKELGPRIVKHAERAAKRHGALKYRKRAGR
jgi:HK97 gp10 family phage protein